MVVYYIPEGFVPKVLLHKNSKSEKPFFGTLPNTSEVITEKCSHLGPKSVVSSVEQSVGGIMNAKYSGELMSYRYQTINDMGLLKIQKHLLVRKVMNYMLLCCRLILSIKIRSSFEM